jgi:pyrroloquinoline-quinone synthase
LTVTHEVIGRVETLIGERSLLTHPFYTKWQAGTLPKPALQEYARQYYAFESSFPRFLSALHSRTEHAGHRQSLLENLWDEEHGEANHAELWLRFAEGIGVPRDDVRGAELNDASRALVATYAHASRESPVAAGVAALYAYERQVPEVATAKIAGLRAHFDVDDARTLSFFELHSALDVEHAAAERAIIEDLGAGQEDEVVAAASDALDAWWDFLSAVDQT